jgi:hypothetical protein
MEIFLWDSGLWTKKKEGGYMYIMICQNMRVNGKVITKVVKENLLK